MAMKLFRREILSWRGCHSSSQLEQMEVGSGSEFLEVHGPHGLLGSSENYMPVLQTDITHYIQQHNTKRVLSVNQINHVHIYY
jgi:hypothetical protein